MKIISLSLLAALAIVSNLQAHCGSCSLDEMESHGEEAHASCAQEQISNYFSVQESLAADDFAAAQNGAKSFLAHAETLACSKESGSCCSKELEAADGIAGAKNISEARLAFKDWSDALMAKVEHGGLKEGEAFKMHCPMAFKNKGASWLQATTSLRNPYFGSMMLTCGMQTNTFGAAAASCCADGKECCEDGASCCASGACEKCEGSAGSANHEGHAH